MSKDQGASFGPGCEPSASAGQESVFAESHPSRGEAAVTEKLGDRLRHARVFRGLTLSGLAREAGTSKSYVWEVETTRRGVVPSIATVERLATALDVDPAWLAGWDKRGDPALQYNPEAGEGVGISSYADHPVSVAETRAARERNGALWAPRDALISALRDIDSGEIEPTQLVIFCAAPARRPSFYRAGADLAGAIGLVEMGKAELLREPSE